MAQPGAALRCAPRLVLDFDYLEEDYTVSTCLDTIFRNKQQDDIPFYYPYLDKKSSLSLSSLYPTVARLIVKKCWARLLFCCLRFVLPIPVITSVAIQSTESFSEWHVTGEYFPPAIFPCDPGCLGP